MELPRLPWEVIERVIENSRGHVATLRSFSRTCRQLRPRSQCLLFARVKVNTADQIFLFVDFLRDYPRLKPFVHSIAAGDPSIFPPFPLLYMLTNVTEIGFTRDLKKTIPALNHSTLTCCRRFGIHIRTLRLIYISFTTCLPLARVLLAFPNVVHLTCQGVGIEKAGHRAPLDLIKRRLSKHMQLKTLRTDYLAKPVDESDASVGDLLFDSDFKLAPSIVESLTILGVPRPDIVLHQSDWSRLQSLVLHVPIYSPHEFRNIPPWLQEVHIPTLKKVTLELHGAVFYRILETVSGRNPPADYKELQHALLRFPQPGIMRIMKAPGLRVNSESFWECEFRKAHLMLSQRGTVKLDYGTTRELGHDASIGALVFSPDGKWVASGSNDSTIIVWNAEDETIAHQWVAHGYQPVQTLAFSSDSRHLASSGKGDLKVAIWDLHQDARKSAVLAGHTETIFSCAWSPDGTLFASGDQAGVVRTWDARTAFRRLRVLDSKKTLRRQGGREEVRVTFSSDGRWLGSASRSQYCVWDAKSGALRRLVPSNEYLSREYPDQFVAFDTEGMRLATRSWDGAVEIYPIEEQPGGQFVFRPPGGTNEVSFSPDGRLILAAMKDGTVRIWDSHTGAQVFHLKAHGAPVTTALFSPCGRYIVSSASQDWDAAVRLWRTSDGSRVATFSDFRVSHLALSSDGKTISFAGADGEVVIRRLHDLIPVKKQSH